MYGAGTRCLIALAAVAVVGTSTPTDAEMSRPAVPDGTYVPSTPTKPTYRRTSAPPVSRAPVRSWAGDSEAFSRVVADASARHGVPERLIWAVIRVESGFDHRAVSRRGARGLMQLMPRTAKLLGVRDSFDPRQNIDAGTRHLRAMIERFPYDLRLAIESLERFVIRSIASVAVRDRHRQQLSLLVPVREERFGVLDAQTDWLTHEAQAFVSQ